MDTRAAYRLCEEITWSQARNFSYGIRLLPPAKRRALAAVYAFARRIDDIGDGSLPAADKLEALTAARAQVTSLAGQAGIGQAGNGQAGAGQAGAGQAGAGQAGAGEADPVLVALADAARRFEIPLAAFGELIDGCEADVRGTTYGTFGQLEHYCRCVAGSIGRLSLGVFGCQDAAVAAPLADALGVALQLTNILRDIREDFAAGRVYLPADDLARFGVTLTPDGGTDGGTELPAGRGLEDVVRFEADRARDWYATGLRLMPLLDRRSAASASAMAGIYFRLLGHISAEPSAALRRRLSLSAAEKAMVAARSLAGLPPAPPPARSAVWP